MNIETELRAIQDNLISLEYSEVSLKQLRLLGSLMSSGMEKATRERRIEILKMFAGDVMDINYGIKITSSKNITGTIASYLIELLKDPRIGMWELSEYGQDLIRAAEARIEVPDKIEEN